MWSLAKFVFLCVVAAAVGLAAVSVPIGDKTAAEHLRALVEAHAPREEPKVAVPAPRPAPSRGAALAGDRPPADDHSDDDRAALERLIEKRTR